MVTILTNKACKGEQGSLVAIVGSIRSDDVVEVLNSSIPEEYRKRVKEITTDLSSAMMSIAHRSFPRAQITNDRFHVQRIVNEAAEDIRREAKRAAREQENKEQELCRENKVPYLPSRLKNGETMLQAISRARYSMLTWREKWTASQEERMEILFHFLPDMEVGYSLIESFRKLFNQRITVQEGIIKLKEWCQTALKEAPKVFRTAVKTIQNNIFTIANYFKNRATNAFAESFNAKLKHFRTQLRGINDFTFFIYRVTKLFA